MEKIPRIVYNRLYWCLTRMINDTRLENEVTNCKSSSKWFSESTNKVAIYCQFLSLWLSLSFMGSSIHISQNIYGTIILFVNCKHAIPKKRQILPKYTGKNVFLAMHLDITVLIIWKKLLIQNVFIDPLLEARLRNWHMSHIRTIRLGEQSHRQTYVGDSNVPQTGRSRSIVLDFYNLLFSLCLSHTAGKT